MHRKVLIIKLYLPVFMLLISGAVKAIDFPEPKYRTAIKAISEGDEEKLGEALNRIHQEDPTVTVEYSKELKQIILSGQGEYHLNIVKWHLDNDYKVETTFVAPKIPYRETITKPAQSDYRHKKQSGGAGQFGEVYMIIEPYSEGSEPKNIRTHTFTALAFMLVGTIHIHFVGVKRACEVLAHPAIAKGNHRRGLRAERTRCQFAIFRRRYSELMGISKALNAE